MAHDSIMVMIGSRIAQYKLTEQLGAGGMGEVYLAEDTSLNRKVALKFLPEALRAETEASSRFQREARAAAALDHPYICKIYEVREAEGHSFISMEYVEGETLSDVLERRQLSVNEALRVGLEIAEALEKAHSSDIIHRDLKPSNVMLTPGGHAKVMDFGLAKRLGPDDAADVDRTVTNLTRAGTTLGTVPYMSPEQLRGRQVDARSDIFSFGVLLYEMLAGEHPFIKDDQIDTASAILRDDPPPLHERRLGVSPVIDHIVRKMLAKDADARHQSIRGVRTDLQQLISRPDQPPVTGTDRFPISGVYRPARNWKPALGWSLALLPVLAVGLFASGLLRWPADASPPKRLLKFDFPWQGHVRPWDGPAVSPDGSKIVYRNAGKLWIRDLADTEARELKGTEGGGQPFWAPDSSAVGYFTNRNLHKIALAGGPPTTLCRLPADFWGGAHWTEGGQILFGQGPKGIYAVAEHGEEPRLVLAPVPEDGDKWLYWPHQLPDGEGLMFVSLKEDGTSEIALRSLGKRTSIVRHPEFLGWSTLAPTGHIVYERGGSSPSGMATVSIWALPFDANSRTRMGEPFRIVAEGTSPTVSATGTLTFRTRPTSHNSLVWVDRRGVIQNEIGRPQDLIRNPAISPDGSHVAVEGVDTSGFDIWIHDGSRGTKQRLTSDISENRQPVWAPDGSRIAFASGGTIFLSDVSTGAKAEQLLSVDAVEEIYLDWSKDGRYLIFHYLPKDQSHRDIWWINLSGKREPTLLVGGIGDDTLPQISPDGRFVLYQSSEGGNYLPDVFLVEFPSGGNKQQVSPAGGTHPRWSPAGDELFYVDPNNDLVAVRFDAETARLGEPAQLFNSKDVDTDLSRNLLSFLYDVGPKAERFVVVRSPGGGRVIVVENWYEEFADRE